MFLWDVSERFLLTNILILYIGNVQVIRIEFTPTQVVYTTFEKRGQLLNCIIVCGLDGSIHLYTEVRESFIIARLLLRH